MDFRTIIKDIMKEEQLTQIELAKKLEISQGHVTDWVRGKCNPGYDHLRNICIKLDISGDRILGLKD